MSTNFHIDSTRLTPCNLAIKARDYNENAEVVELIQSHQFDGWVQTTSRVFVASAFNPDSGAVLAAELIVDSNTSIHIRRSGNIWRTWTYTEGNGDTHRAEEVDRAGIRPVGELKYRVYWQQVEPTAFSAHGIKEWRPFASRLEKIVSHSQENH